MKVLDGHRLHYAFSRGMAEVVAKRRHLDAINVFPVADGDTGTNLSMTLEAMMAGASHGHSVAQVGEGLASAALVGSRGNSGIIFAQFVLGLSRGMAGKARIGLSEFSHAVEQGVETAFSALSRPVEGTILTVMRAWSDALKRFHGRTVGFSELLHHALDVARQALAETPRRLHILETAGVVDAGAEGFVHFVHGLARSFEERLPRRSSSIPLSASAMEETPLQALPEPPAYRYCVEILMESPQGDAETLRQALTPLGDSLMVAGAPPWFKAHVHSDHPHVIARTLLGHGRLVDQKVDDMGLEYAAMHHPLSKIALVTDSACDLPPTVLEKYHIHQVPLSIQWDDDAFLDKVTLSTGDFYRLLDERATIPKSAQPPVRRFERLYRHLSSAYQGVISIHLSGALSGTVEAARLAAQTVTEVPVHVIDAKHLSTSLGLVVLSVAQALGGGASLNEALALAQDLPRRAQILVAVKDLKYMIRGGRVSPLKGRLARIFHLNPLVSLDEHGASSLLDKALGFDANIQALIRRIQKQTVYVPAESWAVGHAGNLEGAERLANILKQILQKPPVGVLDISPIIGAHAGVGAVSASVLWAREPLR